LKRAFHGFWQGLQGVTVATIGVLMAVMLTICAPASGAQRVLANAHHVELGSIVDILVDIERLPVEAVLNDSAGVLPWHKTGQINPSFGFTSATFWARFEIHNPLNTETDSLLEVGYPLLDKVTVFQFEGERLKTTLVSGDAVPFNQRLAEHRLLLFPLTFAANSSSRIYVKIESTSAIQFPIALWTPDAFYQQDQYSIMAHSIYYGLVLVMVLYNFFLYLRIKDSVYLYYVLYVATFCITQMSLAGFAYQLLWPNAVHWNQFCIAVLTPAIVTSGSIFVVKALKLGQLYPQFARSLNGLAIAGVVCAVMSCFLAYHVMIKIGVTLAILACSSALYIVYYAWLVGKHRNAAFFAVAWSVFLVGVLGLTMNKFGVLPRTFLTEYAAQLGSALEIILLSYALADRLHEANKQRFKAESHARLANEALVRAQEEKLRTQAETTQRLESEVQERTRELREAKSIAENANRQKTRFLTAATHDIRQPLQALSLLSETLESRGAKNDLVAGPNDPVAVPNASVTAGKIRKAIDHLIELFERLFDLSKIDNHLIQAQQLPIDPGALLADFTDTLSPLCRAAGVKLTVSTHPGWRLIVSDPVMLQRSLMILADNALKHARCHNLLLSLEAREEGCLFVLEDDGIGIPETEREKVFEEFYQVRNPERNRMGGMGLGLSLCKRLVQLMGGVLSLEPTPLKGCRFVILQPWSLLPLNDPLIEHPVAPDQPIATTRVLVIEDDAEAFDALMAILQVWGMECRGGMNVKTGLDCLLDGWEPDIALIDYRLPGALSGVDLADELSRRTGGQLSIILITGDMDIRGNMDPGSPAIPYPILYKPLKPSLLRAALNRRTAN
jgi:signal transduction histidine kinase